MVACHGFDSGSILSQERLDGVPAWAKLREADHSETRSMQVSSLAEQLELSGEALHFDPDFRSK